MTDEQKTQGHTVEDVEKLVTSSDSSTHQLTYPGSIEQQIFVDSGIKDGLYDAVRGAYGGFMSYLRVPTTIRKLINKQTFVQREKIKLFHDNHIGATVGMLIGVGAPIAYCLLTNYNPKDLLLTTNALFAAYELGRSQKSKQERLEVKAIKESEMLQKASEKEDKKLKEEPEINL